MARKAKNKMKAWRREMEFVMVPRQVSGTDGAQTVEYVGQVIKGKELRDYRRMGMNSKPMPSDLLTNLMLTNYLILADEDVSINNMADGESPTDVIEGPTETI